MNLLPIALPGGTKITQQLLAVHQSNKAIGIWVLLATASSRTLTYCSSHSSDLRFVLPHGFVYVGSSHDGKLFFLVDRHGASTPRWYCIDYNRSTGITVKDIKIEHDHSLWDELLDFCCPPAGVANQSVLHESPLLNDNALNESIYTSVCVPYHSFRDVLRLRALSQSISSNFVDNSVIVDALSGFRSSFPFLSVVDAVQFDSDSVAIVANDSSIRILSCGAEARMFVCKASAKPSLVLGRSVFSIDNSLSIAPSASALIHPSLGLVLATSVQCDSPSSDFQPASLRVISLNSTTTSMYSSSDCGFTFILESEFVHLDQDLVPMLIHHLDSSQTLYYTSRYDRSVVYVLDDALSSSRELSARGAELSAKPEDVAG
jgi:hypothetical protein